MASAMKAGERLSAETAELTAQLAPLSRRRGVWQRFRRHRIAMVGVIILTVLILTAVFAPVIARENPNATNIRLYRQPPSAAHILGNDASGRDVFSRLLYAGRVSLSVGLVAVGIYLLIGLLLGALAGYYGGLIDSIITRIADVVLSFPSLVIIITVVSIVGPSIYNVMLVIGLLGWPPITRLLRGELLSLRERDFVLSGRAIGCGSRQMIFRYLLPNAMAPVIVAATFGMARAILLEAGLSFLGLGVQQPTASWGNMLTNAQSLTVLQEMPWLWLPPGVMIALAVLSINFIGDGLRDALDPHMVR